MYRETHGALQAALAAERRAHGEARREVEFLRDELAQSELASRYAAGRVRSRRWWAPALGGVLIAAALVALCGYAAGRRASQAQLVELEHEVTAREHALKRRERRIAGLVQQRDFARDKARRLGVVYARVGASVSGKSLSHSGNASSSTQQCLGCLAHPGLQLVCADGGLGYRKGDPPKCYAAFRLGEALERDVRAAAWGRPQQPHRGLRARLLRHAGRLLDHVEAWHDVLR